MRNDVRGDSWRCPPTKKTQTKLVEKKHSKRFYEPAIQESHLALDYPIKDNIGNL